MYRGIPKVRIHLFTWLKPHTLKPRPCPQTQEPEPQTRRVLGFVASLRSPVLGTGFTSEASDTMDELLRPVGAVQFRVGVALNGSCKGAFQFL